MPTKGKLSSKFVLLFSIIPKNERKTSALVSSYGKNLQMFCSFFGRIENKKNCFWNYMTFYKYFGFETLAISFPRFTLVWYEMDIDCLVLLQVPKCFVRIQIFWASPKIWLHLVPLQKLLCRSKKNLLNANHLFVLQKMIVTGTICK